MDKALDWAHDLIKLAMADPLLLNAATLIGGLVAVGTIIGGLFAATRWLTGKLHQPRSPNPKLSAPPAADRSLTRYSARAVELLGREAALARLQGFLQADAGFAWMQIAGLGGQGKSRLGYELTLWAQDQGWQAGLLESADLAAFGEERWADWQPARPHLILLDYVIGREAAIKPLLQTLAARADGLRRPVRLLLLERQRWDHGGLAVANRSANRSANHATGPDLAPTLGTDGCAEWFLKLAERYDGNDPVLDATRWQALVLTDGPLSSGAAGPSQRIPPLQPDLLGEWFVLRGLRRGTARRRGPGPGLAPCPRADRRLPAAPVPGLPRPSDHRRPARARAAGCSRRAGPGPGDCHDHSESVFCTPALSGVDRARVDRGSAGGGWSGHEQS